VGSRGSRLALVQTQEAIELFQQLVPALKFESVVLTTPGDRDKTTDLRVSPPDFFTRDLHEAVLNGIIDCAVHSAKDLSENIPDGEDWFWLPGQFDSCDALVLRRGEEIEGLKAGARVGVSSDRRAAYCRKQFPLFRSVDIRGTIEERLAQLDAGKFDMLIMAAAALQRLGLEDRISRRIPVNELVPPDGQGRLAVTFKSGDKRFRRLRSFFIKPVVFVGAGPGGLELCTVAGSAALGECDICLYDALVDVALLELVPPCALRISVGKRCGHHPVDQVEICRLLAVHARRSRRVVRLKGGDPGFFGRLGEEIDFLESLGLPYRVLPGVSSLSAATTGTGMLLTRRGIARGFTVMTPRQEGGGISSVRAEARVKLPLVFLMGLGVLNEIAAQLMAEGRPGSTPVAVVFNAGSVEETVIRGCLADIELKIAGYDVDSPGLIIVGSPAEYGYHAQWGALMGRRILLPCSADLQKNAVNAVCDFGGVPISLPLIQMIPDPACLPTLKAMRAFDWLVLTSPSSVHAIMNLLRDAGLDLRGMPKILVAGPGTAEALKSYGIMADMIPGHNFGAEGLVEIVKRAVPAGATILRLRSQLAGPCLAETLTAAGYHVTDCVLYANKPLRPERIPAFDAVFFASASAVEVFVALAPVDALAGKMVVALGKPTLTVLQKYGVRVDALSAEATVQSAIETLAAMMVRKELEKLA